MTPEEWAKDIYIAYPALVDSSGDEFVAFVAATIRAAVAADRERIVAALYEEHSARGVWAARIVRGLPE